MNIHFLAHAGFYISSEKDGVTTSVVIDPWFTSSTLDTPVLDGLMPGQRTIDFIVPEMRNSVAEFFPDAVLISHFHTHHAPLKDVGNLLAQSRLNDPILAIPQISDQSFEKLTQSLASLPSANKVRFERMLGPLKTFEVGCLRITGLSHPSLGHTAWLVESHDGAFLHIADAMISRFPLERKMDALWEKFKGLKPDFLAISCGGHTTKMETNGIRWIHEASSLSPVEAARIAQVIQPKEAGVMGVFQTSIWTDRLESSLPAHLSEEKFRWALEYLAPKIKCVTLRPGDQIEFFDGA